MRKGIQATVRFNGRVYKRDGTHYYVEMARKGRNTWRHINADSPLVEIINAFIEREQMRVERDTAIQNMQDIAHCMSDLRRFIEMKWPTIADLPSPEGVLLNGPDNKNEVNAMIAALNRVADFYENAGEEVTING